MRDRKIRLFLAIIVVAMAGVGVAMAATRSTSATSGTVKAAKVGKFGTVLVGANGMTLYRYTPDKKNQSVCTGACAGYWPPLLVKGTAKPTAGSGVTASLLGTTMRSNGTHQVTYAGFPLYYYAGDKKPGQANGQGFQKTWYVVSATGAMIKHAAKASGSGGTTTNGTTTKKSAWG